MFYFYAGNIRKPTELPMSQMFSGAIVTGALA